MNLRAEQDAMRARQLLAEAGRRGTQDTKVQIKSRAGRDPTATNESEDVRIIRGP